MNKNSQLIIKTLIIFLLLLTTLLPSVSYAVSWGEIIENGDQFLTDGKNAGGDEVIDGEKVQTEFNGIYNILFALGVVLTVIVGATLGIKYMFGSIEDQAKIKETLPPYLAGCVVIYGAFGIWKLVVTLLASV